MPDGSMPAPVVRRPEHAEFADLPLRWYGDDLDLTLLWNTLSAVFPEGENFFVRAVRDHLEACGDDEELRARVRGFIGQEAAHGVGHRAFNRALARDFPGLERVEREVRFVLKTLAPRLFTPRQRLAITAALEHFTSLLAAQLLEDPKHRGACDHPDTVRLWLWHAFEEVEHEDVAFDVYRAAGGTEFERRWVMAVTTALFVLFIGYFYGVLAADQRRRFAPRGWARLGWFLVGSPGLTRRLLPGYLAYYRRGFHPRDKAKLGLLAEWRERLFDAEGGLRERVGT